MSGELRRIERSATVDRLVADNDPRNGSVATRLIRMLEQPDRQPCEDGLYAATPQTTKDGEGRR